MQHHARRMPNGSARRTPPRAGRGRLAQRGARAEASESGVDEARRRRPIQRDFRRAALATAMSARRRAIRADMAVAREARAGAPGSGGRRRRAAELWRVPTRRRRRRGRRPSSDKRLVVEPASVDRAARRRAREPGSAGKGRESTPDGAERVVDQATGRRPGGCARVAAGAS